MSSPNHDEPWPFPIASHPGEREHTPRCSGLILSGHLLDYIAWSQLGFRENSGAFGLTLSENRLGLHEKSLITSGTAGII
jgi:hypothetical protein